MHSWLPVNIKILSKTHCAKLSLPWCILMEIIGNNDWTSTPLLQNEVLYKFYNLVLVANRWNYPYVGIMPQDSTFYNTEEALKRKYDYEDRITGVETPLDDERRVNFSAYWDMYSCIRMQCGNIFSNNISLCLTLVMKDETHQAIGTVCSNQRRSEEPTIIQFGNSPTLQLSRRALLTPLSIGMGASNLKFLYRHRRIC